MTPEEKAAYQKYYRGENREALRAKQKEYWAKPENSKRRCASTAAYQAANKEKVKVQRAVYRAANREKIAAKQARYVATNRERINARAAAARRENPEVAKIQREQALMRNYGVTPEQVEQMAVIQNHACAICFRVRKLCVDHNHTTGKVRALLCCPCNSAIGLLQESLTVLESAKSYLQKHATI